MKNTTFEVFAITENGHEVELYMGTDEKIAFQQFDFYAQNKKMFSLQIVVIISDDENDRVYIEA